MTSDTLVSLVLDHLERLLQLMVDPDLQLEGNQDIVEQFIAEPQTVLYLVCQENQWQMQKQLVQSDQAWIVVKNGQIQQEKPLHGQMICFPLLKDNLGIVNQFLHYGVGPVLGQMDNIGSGFARKKMAELELSLAHLQQEIVIPETRLRYHPDIERVVQKARSQGLKPSVDALGDLVNDPSFLNAIQGTVNSWIKEIQKVTLMDRDPSNGSARQEIEFWLAMEQSLSKIQEMLQGDEITLSLDTLRAAKRFQATVRFLADTGIKEALDKTTKYNQLMRDFPINELLASTDLDKVTESIGLVFSHLNRKLRLSPYPVARALLLVTAISQDLNQQLLDIMGGKKLMLVPYTEFNKIMEQCARCFSAWDTHCKEFVNVAREVTRKRSEKFIPVKVVGKHTQLQDRIEFVWQFRKAHEHLVATIQKVEKLEHKGFSGANKTVGEALEAVKNIDVLDISQDGVQQWTFAEQTYDEKVSLLENQIISLLRDRLGAAESAKDMFSVFSKFNALFVRPKIRGAVREYQTQLLDRVKVDLKHLHDKFVLQYEQSVSYQIDKTRDIPPTSGLIIWTRQIENQLDLIIAKVESVLGQGWQEYQEGQLLYEEHLQFKRQLDPTPVFDSWIKQVTEKNLSVGGPIFVMERNKLKNTLELKVNFDPFSISVFKEVKHLLWMDFAVPHSIINCSKDCKRVYPFAVALTEALRVYDKTVKQLEPIKLLTAGYHKEMQQLISLGFEMRWDFFLSDNNKHQQFVRDFCAQMHSFADKVTQCSQKMAVLDQLLVRLAECSFQKQEFTTILHEMQTIVDELSFGHYSNLSMWVKQLNDKISQQLLKRLEEAIQKWQEAPFEPMELQIVLKDQILQVQPWIPKARQYLHEQLHKWLGNVLDQPQMVLLKQPKATFMSLVFQVDQQVYKSCYDTIKLWLQQLSDYVNQWLQYQSLWDADTEQLSHLQDDVKKWTEQLLIVKKQRETFDTPQTFKQLSGLVVKFESVQAKISGQYDRWQKDLYQHFSRILEQKTHEYYAKILSLRQNLENAAAVGPISDIVDFCVLMQHLKQEQDLVEELSVLEQAHRLLSRQRFVFSKEWLYIDQVRGEYDTLMLLFDRKQKLFEDHFASLRQSIAKHDQQVELKIHKLLMDWDENKPKDNVVPSRALSDLKTFETRFRSVETEYSKLLQACVAVDIDKRKNDKIQLVLEDSKDLTTVWTALSQVWDTLKDIEDTHWTSEKIWSCKTMLNDLKQQMRTLPNHMRQYSAFEQMQDRVEETLKQYQRVMQLKSEALRPRHWEKIQQQVKLEGSLSTFTLGQLIHSQQLLESKRLIDDILANAQGEMGLETFLQQTRSQWSTQELELVPYLKKCRLVKGWDLLFTKTEDHLNALSAMKTSVYFKYFKDEAQQLEQLLTRILNLLQVWAKVQRQYVYLDGIFSGNVQIKQMMPSESTRFQSMDQELMQLMRKVYKSSLVMDVIEIPQIQKQMDRLSDLLQSIQKSLGQYLERERTQFPRFYFLGDEDLLQVLGSPDQIQQHLKKLFGHLDHLKIEDQKIVSFGSLMETIQLLEPISMACSVFEWLSRLEKGIKQTLHHLLKQSLGFWYLERDPKKILSWMSQYPAQVILLTLQIQFTKWMDERRANLDELDAFLKTLAQLVVEDLSTLDRFKCEYMITEAIHQKDVVKNPESLSQMRFYFDPDQVLDKSLRVALAQTESFYGFEYQGVQERLVQTPLTDRCYLTLAQALHHKLGGSPFGPAGTGKTETVKSMASTLGRMCLVFCCDENFDFQSVGRIFLGLSQVGAWGCFDEFNRLEEKILSAVSQQVQAIQHGLRYRQEIELVGKQLKVHQDTGIFITMNPGYLGRSELPENLRKLFRSVAMTAPDVFLIAQVTLLSQGFIQAEELAKKIVPFFRMLQEQLSKQRHYDFGLRALKSVLVCAGTMHRQSTTSEEEMMLMSIQKTIFPKLVLEDEQTANDILSHFFTVSEPSSRQIEHLQVICDEHFLDTDPKLIRKIQQLEQLLELHHGVMILGEAGCGKSTIYKVLFECVKREKESYLHIIDPKSMDKNALYGFSDPTTREWTDGVFTTLLRQTLDSDARHWIVFDGDVDPEWVENLNSVLDDNKCLTLPNGERIQLKPTVRILFEVENLEQATPATISRCGMLFVGNLVQFTHLKHGFIKRLRQVPYDDLDLSSTKQGKVQRDQLQLADILDVLLAPHGSLSLLLKETKHLSQIMPQSVVQIVSNLFTLLMSTCKQILGYNATHTDFPMEQEQMEAYISRAFYIHLSWVLGGPLGSDDRHQLGDMMLSHCQRLFDTHPMEFDLDPVGELVLWQTLVPQVEMTSLKDVVIPTKETLRIERLLSHYLKEGRSVLLCGPPGSGKTMSLLSVLRSMGNTQIVGLNFSSETSIATILKQLHVHIDIRKSPRGWIGVPKNDKHLVLFCDELNLPRPDKYGTQRVVSFMRQLIERKGYYWQGSFVSLEKIQIVGACNPPTDPGRFPLSKRFLRHTAVLFVDYPQRDALLTIYETMNKSALRQHPNMSGFSLVLTQAMIDFYTKQKDRFTPDVQPHYIYSPRELTRWVKGIYEIIQPMEFVSVNDLVKIFCHEANRLFQDRLVSEEEQEWTLSLLKQCVQDHFLGVDADQVVDCLFSNFLTRLYTSVERTEIKSYLEQRIKTFYEEELDTEIVLFDGLVDHVLRIDRVLRQPQGHLLLIGISGSGKTTLTRFVSWLNGFQVVQPPINQKYTLGDFDQDLKVVLRKAAKGERLVFLMDEGSISDPSFLERMNTLLANAEIPGLFEGDELVSVLTTTKETYLREGIVLEQDQVYEHFCQLVGRNLHIVFTMNPPKDMSGKQAASPALFNRCVLNWMGDWDKQALVQVSQSTLRFTDLGSLEDQVMDCFVHYHLTLRMQHDAMTPRQFMDALKLFVKLLNQKKEQLQSRQQHLTTGLEKLKETVEQVQILRLELAEKRKELDSKSELANQKLQVIVKDQQEAEQQQTKSMAMKQQLIVQRQEIETRKQQVVQELLVVEPRVLEAQQSVSSIKKQHLTEMRSMSNPPNAVKVTMEAVCILLGHKTDSWKAVQAVLRRDDFITSIVNYETEKLDPVLRERIEQEYMSDASFSFDVVNRASKACGPLLQWVVAQVQYNAILERVGPLRLEVEQLESKALKAENQLMDMDAKIQELESRIHLFKEDYGMLMSQIQTLKQETETVTQKVERSVVLLENLSSERERWEDSRHALKDAMETLIGDCLVSSAFLSYCGFFDQHHRQELVQMFKQKLEDIRVHKLLSIPEYLSEAKDVKMMPDALSVENAVIIKQCLRYPFLIDPSGQSLAFLRHLYPNLVQTSFRDPHYLKTVESSIRFGTPVLIQDAEEYDTILNPIMNRQIKRNGSRTMIQLGQKEVDFSSSFFIILMTTDPFVQFTPDLSSRCTIVNFTMTPQSLYQQSLDKIMQHQRPDIDQKRRDLIKIQGTYQERLFDLETNLLQSLNDCQSNILQDNQLMITLEKLKQESLELEQKMQQTDEILDQVQEALQEFAHIAETVSQIYLHLDQLSLVQQYYQFSHASLTSVFERSLERKSSPEQLEDRILQQFFQELSYSLKPKDLYTLGLLFVMIKTRDHWTPRMRYLLLNGNENPLDQEFDIQSSSNPERQLLDALNMPNKHLFVLLVIKWKRPDRLFSTIKVLAKHYLSIDIEQPEIDIQRFKGKPIFVISDRGHDASSRIESLAEQEQEKIVSVAMGAPEALRLADRAISQAQRTGGWVLIKNVHLARHWLADLQKKKLEYKCQLFLTGEEGNYDISLLRSSKILYSSQTRGIKTSMLDQIHSIPKANPKPVEKHRILLSLVWLHSIVMERLRYVPLGWTKSYDFSDADFDIGVKIIDELLPQKEHVAPEKIEWTKLKSLILECYGSKIDHPTDLNLLEELVEMFIDVRIFSDCAFFGIRMPQANQRDKMISWIHDLPPSDPSWSGLSVLSDQVINKQEALKLVHDLKRMDKQKEKLEENLIQERLQSLIQMIPKLSLQHHKGNFSKLINAEIDLSQELLSMLKSLETLQKAMLGEMAHTNETRYLLQCVKTDIIPHDWHRYDHGQSTLTSFVKHTLKKMEYLSRFQESSVWLGGLFFPQHYLTMIKQMESKKMQVSMEQLYLEARLDKGQYTLENIHLHGMDPQLQLIDSLEPIKTNVYLTLTTTKPFDGIPLYWNTNRSSVLFYLSVDPKGWRQRGVCATVQ